MPTLATTSVSLRLKRAIRRIAARHDQHADGDAWRLRKIVSLPTVIPIMRAESPEPVATAVRIASSMTATRSSNRATPKTSSLRAFSTLLFGERLGDDRGAGDGDHRAGEEAFDHAPAEGAADDIAEPHQQSDLDDGDETRGGQEAEETAKAELQADREHQQDDAKLGELFDAIVVDEDRNRQMWADDHPGDEIADHDRLAQRLENHGGDGGDAKQQSQIVEKIMAW